LVLERSLAGPLGLCVKFSTLQEYGVDRVFFIDNENVDSSQRNVVFLARGDKASTVTSIASTFLISSFWKSNWDVKVDRAADSYSA
jgi:hypothetical protein